MTRLFAALALAAVWQMHASDLNAGEPQTYSCWRPGMARAPGIAESGCPFDELTTRLPVDA